MQPGRPGGQAGSTHGLALLTCAKDTGSLYSTGIHFSAAAEHVYMLPVTAPSFIHAAQSMDAAISSVRPGAAADCTRERRKAATAARRSPAAPRAAPRDSAGVLLRAADSAASESAVSSAPSSSADPTPRPSTEALIADPAIDAYLPGCQLLASLSATAAVASTSDSAADPAIETYLPGYQVCASASAAAAVALASDLAAVPAIVAYFPACHSLASFPAAETVVAAFDPARLAYFPVCQSPASVTRNLDASASPSANAPPTSSAKLSCLATQQ
mmetsp:Transcript_5193/g.14499  ORF Transcript_5193/g.14499 Transcript_5193/m.14499 type:complete len:273 (+) Transcript_5193:109-927(+)